MAGGRIRVLAVAVGAMVPALVAPAAGAVSGVEGVAQPEMAAVESPRVGHNFPVSRASGDDQESALVYNEVDNEYLAVWADGRREETRGTDIFGQRLTPKGERIGSAFRISGWAAANDQRQPAVAYNSVDNEYLVVWADLRKQEARGWEIYGQRVSADGQRLGYNFRLSGARAVRDEWRPAVAFGLADSAYVVFWMDSRRRNTPGTDVFGQLVDANGERVGHNFGITSTALTEKPGDPRFVPIGGPAVAYNSTGNEFLVVWPDGREKAPYRPKVIYGQRLTPNGERVNDPFRISGENSFNDRSPAVVYDSGHDQYLIVWVSDTLNDFSTVFGQRLAGAGTPIDETFRIDDGNAFHVKTPAVTHDAAHDRYLAVWQDERSSRRRALIIGQFITVDGRRLHDNFAIQAPTSRRAYEPAAAYSPRDGQHMVIWTDWRNRDTRGSDIYGQRVTADGA
jgi:hypothetical protein